ncbi:DUF6603 domain-containing protein [Haloferax sp. DFSO52]|uniref:DUF6603 domain-containing protein n=1 Tax=Haloferax sp. DFSO52 TaxID=3388505 RepID=UPI003A8B9916
MTAEPPDDPGTLALAARELLRVVEPVIEAVDDGPVAIIAFLDECGVGQHLLDEELERVLSVVEDDIADPVETLSTLLEDDLDGSDVLNLLSRLSGFDPTDPDPEQLLTAVEALVEPIQSIVDGFETLSELEFETDALDEAGEAILNHLFVRYLRTHHEGAHHLLRLGNVIVLPDSVPDWHDGTLEPENLSTLLENPVEAVATALNWGDPAFRDDLVVGYLKAVFDVLGVATRLEPPLTDEQAALIDAAAATNPDDERFATDFGAQLAVPIVQVPSLGAFGVRVVPTADTTTTHPGLALVLYGPFDQFGADIEMDVGGGWTFDAALHGELDRYGLVVQPQKTEGDDPIVQFRALDGSNEVLDEAHAEASLERDAPGEEDRTLLGASDGTGIVLDSVAARARLDFSDGNLSLAVELPVSGKVKIRPEGSFLTTVLPENGLVVDGDVTLGWSNVDGLYFEGGGTLSASIPTHLDFGFGSLDELYFAVDQSNPDADFTINAATSPTITLGPLTGSIRRLGLSADVSFPADRDGNMGPLNLELGFRPPDGIGIAVDSGAVTGGGFLQFEPEHNRYSGGLELQFSSWGLKAVGLLNTEVPGSDGYSLLVLITADLPPTQLGFGFVLTGIGGLAGIHRGFEKKPLGKAVRSGNLDSVLFPQNVVENADQIITDLRAIFPPKADRHVFGPMVRLGWGTPVIIQAELGVLVSIPDWKIALLGKLMLDLPDEEVALIDINLAVVGILDIPGEELSIDASLYDSRISTWTISGDMAMRLSWGADSRFILSIGGFHPRYSPPESFPELDRITSSLSPPGGNPRLEYTGYFAVTPNTFQVGAGAVLHGKFGPATVDGELSFDALFRFNPFEFVVDFVAKVAVRISGTGLGLKLDGTLSGPQPYRVRGKLHIDILFISVSVSVDARFGSSGGSTELPTANVLPELLRALETTANWSAQKPTNDDQLVTLRDPNAKTADSNAAEPASERVIAHPLGTLGVRQQVVPLAVDIEKYGNAKPAHTRFELSELSVTGVGRKLGGQAHLREEFAPARFRKMTDSEKLESKAFERLPAGQRVENGAVHYAGQADPSLLSWATLDYESSVIDAENESARVTEDDVDESWDGRLDLSTGHELAEESAVASAGTRTTGPAQYANPGQSLSLSVADQRFVVAWRDTLSRVEVDGNPSEGLTRVEAQDRLRSYVAATPNTDESDLQVVGTQEVVGAPEGESQ